MIARIIKFLAWIFGTLLNPQRQSGLPSQNIHPFYDLPRLTAEQSVHLNPPSSEPLTSYLEDGIVVSTRDARMYFVYIERYSVTHPFTLAAAPLLHTEPDLTGGVQPSLLQFVPNDMPWPTSSASSPAPSRIDATHRQQVNAVNL